MTEAETAGHRPALTPEARRRCLEAAMAARTHAARVRESIRVGSVTLAEALADEANRSMRVGRMLRAVPGIGRAKSTAILEAAGVDESRRVRGLGPRQRETILKHVGGR